MYRAGRIYNSINIIYIIYVRSPTQNVCTKQGWQNESYNQQFLCPCMMHNLEWTLTSHPKHRSKLASNKLAISFEDFSLWIWVKTWACKELSGSWAISAVSGLASWLAGTSMIQHIYPQTRGDSQVVKSIIIESCDIFFAIIYKKKHMLVAWALKFERGRT